jgi:hypothetical protein
MTSLRVVLFLIAIWFIALAWIFSANGAGHDWTEGFTAAGILFAFAWVIALAARR